MADAPDSKSVARKGVWVQVPPPALRENMAHRGRISSKTVVCCCLEAY